MNMGHVFSQCELAAAALVGDRAGVGGATARARCKLGLLLGSRVGLRSEWLGAGTLRELGFSQALWRSLPRLEV